MYRVALVCLGNICRSPMADVVLNSLLDEAALTDQVEVTSCGTGDWHIGEPMDPRAAEVLTHAGYDATRHRARQFGDDWHDHDLILAMDSTNLADVLAQLPPDRHDRVRLFRASDPQVDPAAGVPDVPDPWYGGPEGFADVLDIVERTARALVRELGVVR